MNTEKNLGCAIMIIPAIAFLIWMKVYKDVGPVEGTTMWIVFFIGFWIMKIADKKQGSQESNKQSGSNSIKSPETRTDTNAQIEKIDTLKRNSELKTSEKVADIIIKVPTNISITQSPKAEPIPNTKIEIVNYTSRLNECFDNYPILRFPKRNMIIRSYRTSKINKQGVTEAFFYSELKKHFVTYLILNDISITLGNEKLPFEPDIAIISTSATNIRIDIEIDEPYSGISRQITHCGNIDLNRDNYFVERGWIVIRFSEYQVFKHTKSCMKYIAVVLMSIIDNMPLPFELLKEADLKNEMKWDEIQAMIWEQENYRENYLNINFSGNESEAIIKLNSKLNAQESLEERILQNDFYNHNKNLSNKNSIKDSLVTHNSANQIKLHGIDKLNKKKEDDKSSNSFYKIGCLMIVLIFIVINLIQFLVKSCVDAILH